MKEKVNTAVGKKILSLVREGDYAHPGEEEANLFFLHMLIRGITMRVMLKFHGR
jgi:hypothetical protein